MTSLSIESSAWMWEPTSAVRHTRSSPSDMNEAPLYKLKQATNQLKDLEEVQISIQDILYPLEPLLAQGTHSIADPMQSHASGEEQETLQEGLTTCYVFQLQVWDSKCKLQNSIKIFVFIFSKLL